MGSGEVATVLSGLEEATQPRSILRVSSPGVLFSGAWTAPEKNLDEPPDY